MTDFAESRGKRPRARIFVVMLNLAAAGCVSGCAQFNPYEPGSSHDMKDPKAIVEFAARMKVTGAQEQAFGTLERALREYPDHADLLAAYGRLALALGKDQAARGALLRARRQGADDWRVLSALGVLQTKAGDYAGARTLFHAALARSPGNAVVLNNLALAYILDGHPRQAEQILRKADAVPSRDRGKLRGNLALALAVQGRFDKARMLAEARFPASLATGDPEEIRLFLGLPPVEGSWSTVIALDTARADP